MGSGLGRGDHAAPGESIADREKVTETKVTERFRDMDRTNPENPGANPNVDGGCLAEHLH